MTKYLLAVSGGVDSMVLLDMVATNAGGFRDRHFAGAGWMGDFVVAHYDHGIRGEESHADADFVRDKCRQYGVKLIPGRGELPPHTGEEVARQARYGFLCQAAKKESENGGEEAYIVTAHHQDDLLETIVMNLIRGTGWRGLAPMSRTDVVRPLIDMTKADVVRYALEHDLDWREDKTNDSPEYWRNRLRAQVIGRLLTERNKMLALCHGQRRLRVEIDNEVTRYIKQRVGCVDNRPVMYRYDLIMLPADVAIEILRRLTKGWLTRPQLGQLLLFIKVGKPSKQLSWKRLNVRLDVRRVYFYPEM